MEIMKLIPTGKDYLWGGTRLREEYGKKIDLTPLAETWECSVHPDGPSFVANGTYKGKTLSEVLKAHPKYLGTKVENGELPVLVKFIDAKKDLSVQVHPNDESLMQNGAVIASVASELITNMVQFVYMKKKVKFKLNMKPLVQSIITVAAMAVCVWKVGTLNFSNTVLLALEVIVGSVVYVVLNILMKNQLMLEVINMTKQRIHNATKKRI